MKDQIDNEMHKELVKTTLQQPSNGASSNTKCIQLEEQKINPTQAKLQEFFNQTTNHEKGGKFYDQNGISAFQKAGKSGEDRAVFAIHDGDIQDGKKTLQGFFEHVQQKSNDLYLHSYNIYITEDNYEKLTQNDKEVIQSRCQQWNALSGFYSYTNAFTQQQIKQIKETFNKHEINFEGAFRKEAKVYSVYSGSTACNALFAKDKNQNASFTIANLGDSGCAMLIQNKMAVC